MYDDPLDDLLGMYSAAASSILGLEHVVWMCTQVPDLIDTDREKALRWLGFIQGAFWALGIYTIDEMREHTRELSASA